MIGSNKLELCESELLVAIQEYLDKRMGAYAPKADSVTENKSDYYFAIKLVPKEVLHAE